MARGSFGGAIATGAVATLLMCGAVSAQQADTAKPDPVSPKVANLDQPSTAPPAPASAAEPTPPPVDATANEKPAAHIAPEPQPSTAMSAPTQAAEQPSKTAAAEPPAPVDPVVIAIVDRLKRPVPGVDKADMAALVAFYGKRTNPLLTVPGAWSAVGQAVAAELARSDDWGLPAKPYAATKPTSADPSATADAEIALAVAILRYARHSSGGRVDPTTLSRLNDMKPTYADPDDVLTGLANTEASAAAQPGKAADFLLSLHPSHPQYKMLHQALVKIRHGSKPVEAEPVVAGPVVAQVPSEGPTLKVGTEHKDVPLIRARLAVAGDTSNESYDTNVATAVKKFQAGLGLKQTGNVDKATRAALAGGEAKKKMADPVRDAEKIALALERWRWLPRDLGQVHIMNNIPEFTTRFWKDGKLIFEERIVTGKPHTPTPVFSALMRSVVFNPEWGVPDSIKVKELWPSLRRQSPDDLFGGSSDTRILQRQNMRVQYNGQVIDPTKVNWATADPRQYQFIQAAGGGNVLGVVKFLFPNRHDVYMHDTQERHLFQQTTRAYSHGCMRVNNPRRLAEIIMAEAESPAWTPEKVASAIAAKGTQEIKLDRPFPVHVVYMTARVDDTTGKVETFNDLYGHDTRLVAALAGKPVQLEDIDTKSELTSSVRQQIDKRKPQSNSPDPISSFLSGIFAN